MGADGPHPDGGFQRGQSEAGDSPGLPAAADAAEQQARTAQDAAIRREAAAAAEAVPLVKLLEVPVTQEAAQVDVDVSQIDFTQYTEVWIVPILSTAYHYIYLLRNNIATDSYFHPGTHQNYLCRLEMSGLLGQGKAKIRLATYLSPIACICEHIYDTSNPPYYSTIPSIAPKDLKTLNFMTDAGTINGEGKITSGAGNCNPKERPRTKVRGAFRLFRCWRRRNGSFTSSFPLPAGPKPVQILASRVSVQGEAIRGRADRL